MHLLVGLNFQYQGLRQSSVEIATTRAYLHVHAYVKFLHLHAPA